MSSPVSICNMALSHIKAGSINAMVDKTEQARQCGTFYDEARQYVLRMAPWSFATKHQALAQSEQEVMGWEYSYTKPQDCLMARNVYNESTIHKTKGEEFILISNLLVCRITPAYLEYTEDVEDTNRFDPSFRMAFSYKLAQLLAIPLTGDAKLSQNMIALYQIEMDGAELNNIREGRIKPKRSSKYIEGR